MSNTAQERPIISGSFYPDHKVLMQELCHIRQGINQGTLGGQALQDEAEYALQELEQLGTYAPYSDAHGSVGGGAGYSQIYTTGDFIASDDNTFFDAAAKATAGQVIFIPEGTVIDLTDMKLTDYPDFTINSGVTIASNRGFGGSYGGVLRLARHISTMFTVLDNVRITGLVLEGPDPLTHEGLASYQPLNGMILRGCGIEIDNCELSGFSGCGIIVESGDASIHHCYIHHIRGVGHGHGIYVKAGNASVCYNLFSHCANTVTVESDMGKATIENNTKVNNTYCRRAAKPPYYRPLVLSESCYADMRTVYRILLEGQKALLAGSMTDKEFCMVIEQAINKLGTYSRYPQHMDSICISHNKEKYGAYIQNGDDPIGGGIGYSDILTGGNYNVSTTEEFLDATQKAQYGEVIFVKSGCVLDFSEVARNGLQIELRPGVILASDRGFPCEDGFVNFGAVIRCVAPAEPLFIVHNDVRVTGLVFEGPNHDRLMEHHKRSFYTGRDKAHDYYYLHPFILTRCLCIAGSNVRIDNCELSGFGCYSIALQPNARQIRVDHCYIHHNQTNGLGYGVSHSNDTESIVEYCLFNYNRHSIASSGAPVSGYIARHNIEMGVSLHHCFDVHGGSDRRDGTNIAGTYCEIYNNTFLADAYPYLLRGVPEKYQHFHHNICIKPFDFYDSKRLKGENVTICNNIFGLDPVTLEP